MIDGQNKLLALFSSADLAALRMEKVCLGPRARLEEPGRKIPYVYFPTSRMAAIVYNGKGDTQAEIAVFGYDGCSGCSVILGSALTPQLTIVLVPGEAWRAPSATFINALELRPHLRKVLNHYVHTMIIQRDETAVSAARGTVLQRLARCLLMCADRADGSTVRLTHEVIADMLGVRRAGITNAMGWLQKHALVESRGRGATVILDRQKLIDVCIAYYGAQEREFGRLYPDAITA